MDNKHLKIAFDLSNDRHINVGVDTFSQELRDFIESQRSGKFVASNGFVIETDTCVLLYSRRIGLSAEDSIDGYRYWDRTERDAAVEKWKVAFAELKEAFENRPAPPAEDFTIEF
jgi:hypothetical protein